MPLGPLGLNVFDPEQGCMADGGLLASADMKSDGAI